LVKSLEPVPVSALTATQSGAQQFVADHGRRAAVGSQCGHGGLRG
jgi:hypothetical protein